MKIDLLSFEVQNFLSIGFFKHDIGRGIISIQGINKDDDKASSNGSGKSSIFTSAIRWCLFGKAGKDMTSDGVVNEIVGKDCHVFVTFKVGDEYKRIERYRKDTLHGDSIRIFTSAPGSTDISHDISRHTNQQNQQLINNILKDISQDLFTSTVILSSEGLENKFSSLTDSGKRYVIEKLRDYSWITKCQEITFNEIKIIKDGISSLQVNIEKAKAVIDSLKSQEDRLIKLIESNSMESLNNEAENIENSINQTKKEIESLETKLVSINEEELLRQKDNLSNEIVSINYNMVVAENVIKDTNDLINNPEKRCRLCGTLLSKADPDAIADAKVKSASAKRDLDSYIVKRKSIEEKLSEVNKAILEITNIKNKLSGYKSTLSSLNSKLDALNRVRSDRSNTIEQYRVSLKENREEQDRNNEIIKKSQDKIDRLNLDLSLYNVINSDVYGTKGIKAYLINKDIDFLNERLKEYSSYLFSNGYCQLFQEIQDDGSVPKITIGLVSTLSSKPSRSYSNLSQGEKRKCDIAIQLAIHDLVNLLSSVRFNFLVLDEIFDNIDSAGIKCVIDLLKVKSQSVDVIYLITHNPNIDRYIDKKIYIVKENGISSQMMI